MAMKTFLISAFAVLSITVPVAAKDVALILNDQERQVLVQILDEATKAKGLLIARQSVYMLNKLDSAAEVVPHNDKTDKPEETQKSAPQGGTP